MLPKEFDDMKGKLKILTIKKSLNYVQKNVIVLLEV